MLYEITMKFVKDTFTTALDKITEDGDRETTRSFIVGAKRTRGGEVVLLSDYLPGVLSARKLNEILEEVGIVKAYYGRDIVCGKCFDPVTRMTKTVTKRGKKSYRPTFKYTQYFKRVGNTFALKTDTLGDFEAYHLDALIEEHMNVTA